MSSVDMSYVIGRFVYSEADQSAIVRSLSTARLSTYIRLVGNDSVSDALELYAHNARLSGSFLFPLQAVEVTLRNKCDLLFSERFGAKWAFDGSVNLTQWQQGLVSAMVDGAGVSAIDVLPFGFWAAFFARSQDALWREMLHTLFLVKPSAFTRKKMFATCERIRLFRNRIAHHEQIIGHDPARMLFDMRSIIEWLDPGQLSWFDHHTGVRREWARILQERSDRGWRGF